MNSLDDKLAEQVIADVRKSRPELAFVLEAAINATPAEREYLALLFPREDGQWLLQVIREHLEREGVSA